MSVYNKELIIDGEAVLSPEQQVYKNAKDIKTLKQYIKEAYHTSSALTSSSVSVATEDVEGLGEASSGWLLTDDGLLFKITANDGTTTLIQFFSDISGPQGPAGQDGATLEIDDSGTSASKVWSSQKTNTEVNSAKTMSTVYMTTATPTYNSGDDSYTFNISDINDMPTNNTILGKEIVQIVDSKIKYVYGIRAYYVNGTVECELLGEVGGGKKMYNHFIFYNNYQRVFNFVIVNAKATSLTTHEIYEILKDSGHVDAKTKMFGLSGYDGLNSVTIIGFYVYSNTDDTFAIVLGNNGEVNLGTLGEGFFLDIPKEI